MNLWRERKRRREQFDRRGSLWVRGDGRICRQAFRSEHPLHRGAGGIPRAGATASAGGVVGAPRKFGAGDFHHGGTARGRGHVCHRAAGHEARHRMLFGQEFLQNFEVSMELHRLQVEREFRTNWLRLRQSVLLAPAKRKARWASCSLRFPVLRAVPARVDRAGPAGARHQTRSGECGSSDHRRESVGVSCRYSICARESEKSGELPPIPRCKRIWNLWK